MSSQSSLAGGKKEEKGKNIQVVVRCRPFNAVERKSASYGVLDCDQNRKEVTVKTGGVTDKLARKTYTFDMVFGPSAKQIEVYRSVLCPILDEVMMGYNCTVFAYGQTGTGKTFTMEGERSTDGDYTWEEDPLAGIIPRTLHQIFDKLSYNNAEFSVKVSLLEIYNEELFDLLSPSPDVTERLQMFDDPRNKRGVVIKGLEEITVHNKDEVYQILERGAAKRKTASTLMNAYSRYKPKSIQLIEMFHDKNMSSCYIPVPFRFSVTIHMKEVNLEGEELVKIGKLNLVDLAGSENIGRSGAVDKRAREAGNINQSLLTLGRVITALVERRPHVPYRESKLTRILQDSLGGRTKTSIIATVSPASINLEETMSTLDYASRAKNILNKPEVNQKLTKRTLIKEYTEEIERLKRDLAATRDKHGVYLSAENYETMNSKIMSQELQITEYMDKLTVMEDELKKALELFSDSKEQAEQLTVELEGTRLQLQAAHRDLQETRLNLSQEVFITSKLVSTEGELYNTADKLLSTADVSTKDVSGLHAKLDRKRQVEQHNSTVQQSFAQHMEASYSQMQRSLQQQSSTQHGFMDFFTNTVSNLQKVNSRALEEAVSSVTSYKAGVKAVLVENVGQCVTKLEQQESLSVESKESLLHILEEHQMHLEEALMAQALPTVNTLISMMGNLTETVASQRTLIQRMEVMKCEMTQHLDQQAQALSEMRGAALQGFSSLQAEIGDLKEKLGEADQMHKTSLSQLLECLQGQLSLLSENTQSSFQGLRRRTEALAAPLDSLQQALHTKCSEAEKQERSTLHSFETTVDRLVSETSRVADDLAVTLEESAGYRRNLQTSLQSLGETASEWCHKATECVEAATQAQVELTHASRDALLSLAQPVELRGEALLQESTDCFRRNQIEASGILNHFQDRTGKDIATIQLSREDLSTQATQALEKVHDFLRNELREDVPTGTTPQRKEFSYPRVLVRSRGREELIEEFHAQMEELQDECDSQEEPEEESKATDQGSVEEEIAASDVSTITEPSFVDVNIMCDENSRGPFFKQKRNGKKKENRKAPSVTKQPEVEVKMYSNSLHSTLEYVEITT